MPTSNEPAGCAVLARPLISGMNACIAEEEVLEAATIISHDSLAFGCGHPSPSRRHAQRQTPLGVAAAQMSHCQQHPIAAP